LYNLAIKTTIGLSTFEFENTLTISRIPKVKLKEILGLDKLIQQYKLTHVIIHYEYDFKVIKFKDVKEDDLLVPIFITNDSISRGGDIPFHGEPVRPTVDEETLSVYIGNSKLFSLPYWRCKQSNNMTAIQNYKIKNIPFGDYLRNSHLERYLNSRLSKHRDYEKVDNMLENEYYYYLDEISKHKIYDIDWSTIIKIENKDVLKIISEKSTLQKTYEKKISK